MSVGIHFEHIVKKYGDNTIIPDLNLDVKEGEFFTLLGPSGCGKTTLLRMVAGFNSIEGGTIAFNGKVINDIAPNKRNIGMVFQNYAVFPHMTVRENVAFGLENRHLPKNEIKQRVDEILETVKITQYADRLPERLSGGQQQRVALARILVSDPQILLLDEPFSALDQHLRFRLERELHQTLREFGKTAIFVSHDRDEVYRLADRIVVMEHGRVETSGTKKDVFRDPHTRAAAALTGCKNISRAAMLPDGSFEAADWGITLRKPGFSGGCVGIRMHDVRPGRGENEVRCDVAEVIENPFSFTVLLRPAGRTDTTPVGWEMEKDVWRAQQAEQLWVHFPTEGLLALEETEGQV